MKMFCGILALACLVPLSTLADGHDASDAPCVALTFDDGPDAQLTPRLLAVLAQEKVPATFYLVGKRVRHWPDIVRLEAASGNEIGNHSWSHPQYARLRQFARTDREIEKVLGTKTPPTTLRAPYGELRASVARAELPRPFIFWSVDTLDWKYPDPARIAQVASQESEPGAIILMHDIHPTTVEAVPAVIEGLRARGFVFKTVSGLAQCSY